MQALISIHDVMPETLNRVGALVDSLPESARPGTLLLVVPGRDWRPVDLAQLSHWQAQGLELAGHGWQHRAERISGWYHRLHSRLLSRDAAEHLSQPRDTLRALLERNHAWFAAKGLAAPALYVPPAWALGALRQVDLARSPFAYVETTSGLLETATGERRWLPLAGYEADTSPRALSLRVWNGVNQCLATKHRPLRLALHPYDLELLLAKDLQRRLQSLTACLDYRSLFTGRSTG